jgi:hypothetical protein
MLLVLTTATTAATTDVAAKTTSAAKTGDVTTTHQRITARSATYLPTGDRQPQRSIPARQEVDQHDRRRPKVQHE